MMANKKNVIQECIKIKRILNDKRNINDRFNN